jgi:hypothetical protein
MFDWVGVVEMMRKAAGLDPGVLSDAELLSAVPVLAHVQALKDAAEAHLLAELDARGITDAEFGLSTGTWLARTAGVPASTGQQRVKVAGMLRSRLHEVDEALVDGRISWEHARVLARVCQPRLADAVTGLQGELIGLADGQLFEGWRRQVANIVEVLDSDGAHDPNADLARNQLTVTPTFDGVTHVAGMLVGEGAVIARQAIDAVADELFRAHTIDNEHTPDIEIPSRTTLRALAFVELCRRGRAADPHATAAPRPDVTLVIRADEPDQATTTDGIRLADGTTRTLCCDPDLTAVVVDGLGVPLDMGRRTRLATPAQRRALTVRDGGCIFPGCGAGPGWCDAHHVDPHHLGGRTDLRRLALLCRRHHGVTHRAGWSMRGAPDGRFIWTTPSGRTLQAQRHGRQPARAPDP